MSSSTPEPYDAERFRLAPRRPTSVFVLAILHLIFGGFGVFAGLCSGVIVAIGPANIMPQPPPPPPGAPKMPFPPDLAARQQRFIEQAIPYYQATQVAQAALWVVLAAMLVVAGVGLLRMRPWARKLSLAFAIAAIAWQLAWVVFSVSFLFPAMGDFYTQMEKEFPQAGFLWATSRAAVWAGLLVVPLMLAYPVVVLVLLNRRTVVDAFAGRPAAPAAPERDRPAGWHRPPPDAITR